MKKLLAVIFAFLSLFFNLWGQTDWEKVIGKASGSLVNMVIRENVESGKMAESMSMGSGVIFEKRSDDYYFATISASIEGLEHKKCYVLLASGKEFLATFVGKEESLNLAVYKFSPSVNLDVIIQEKNDVLLGQEICVVSGVLGQNGGVEICASSGIIARKGINLEEDVTNSQIFEVDANVTANGMGGLVIAPSGKMLGFVIDGTVLGKDGRLQQPLILSSLSFSELTKRFISEFAPEDNSEQKVELKPLAPEGLEFHGLKLKDLTEQDLSKYNLLSTDGVLIESVTPGSAGEKAGFVAGDFIVGAEKYKVSSIAILKKIEKMVEDKGVMKIFLAIEGGRKSLTLQLGENSVNQLPGLVSVPKVASNVGIVVSPLNEKQREDLDFGVFVLSVASGSAYEKAGLSKGDIIQEIQDVLVESKEMFDKELGKFKQGDRVLFYVVHADGSYGYVTVDI